MKSVKTNVIILVLIIIIPVLLTISLYVFDKIATPIIMTVADGEMRARAIEIINKSILDEYSEEFNYNKIINVEKDKNGSIVMINADTLKLNKIACEVVLKSQESLRKMGSVGIKVPMGYIFKNNILATLGPKITIKMQPIGVIETKYHSQFESAGINQTRHSIYIEVNTGIRVVIPFKSNDLNVRHEIPICETIIVGNVPDTSINLDMDRSNFSLPNNKNQ